MSTDCPLCGQPNACAMAADGSAATDCWCRRTAVPPELLAQLPEAQRGQACICAMCIAQWQAKRAAGVAPTLP